MAPPPLVFDFIGIVFEAILYGEYLFNTVQNVSWALCHLGLYCLIYGLYWRIQLKRADRWKGVLLYALTANFILCTAYFIINIIQVQFFISVSSYLQDILLFFVQISRRSTDFRIHRSQWRMKIHWYLLFNGWPLQTMHYIPPSISFQN